jgi:multidrug resistance efflux pump
MTVRAGVDGRVYQFVLRVGDIIQPAPLFKAAGILIPDNAGQDRLLAGFDSIEAQVLQVGMAAEATCMTKPMAVIPLVVINVQSVIAAGQITATDQLTDLSRFKPGTVTVALAPLYDGVLDDVPPGSSCIVNAYSNNHDLIASGKVGTLEKIYLHGIDAVALIHALIIRLQAIVMPLKVLVFANFGGGH